MRNTLYLLSLLALLAIGCDSTGSDSGEEIVAETVSDLAADPTMGRDPNTGAPISSGKFTLYSLRENEIIANADSLTNKWDLGFRGTTIIVNGGAGRAGEAGAQIVTGAFEELDEAPATGYNQDDGTTYAIPTGGGNGWYNYNGATNAITPIPGRVIAVRTADGRYAKVSIVSYYKGNPATVEPTSESRYYTFRYVFQPDGSRVFVDLAHAYPEGTPPRGRRRSVAPGGVPRF